jgi:hypothetical protein
METLCRQMISILLLTLDDEVIRLNAYEESDPASIKSVILTPLYFAKPGKTNYSLQINVNRQNIEIKDIEVIFINPGKSNPILPASVGNTEDTYPKPPVVTRTQWGCPQGTIEWMGTLIYNCYSSDYSPYR